MYPSLLARLNNQHESIAHLIQNLDTMRLTIEVIPGKWSIKDNIAHLATYQPIFLERVQVILTIDEPVFERYKADYDPEFEAWQQQTVPALLSRIEDDRKTIYDTISSLTPAEIHRTGIHKKFVALTITQWTEFFLFHEAHHLFTIFQLVHGTKVQ